MTSKEIDKAREYYRPAAARASLLYFILNELNTINPIYQFSLKVIISKNLDLTSILITQCLCLIPGIQCCVPESYRQGGTG